MTTISMTSLLVDTQEKLRQACQQFKGSNYIAVDTEFIRERTYYPKLGLVQIATEQTIICIDPLALEDLSSLAELLFDVNTTKVLHAGQQDMEIFYHLFGKVPKPVFDSQIAAALLGLGVNISYAALIKSLLDVELHKSHTRTDWLRRPLSTAQLEYAADDVRYLAKAYPVQKQKLQEQSRLSWLEEDFAAMSDPELYRPQPEKVWRKIKGFNKLKGVQLAVLKELAAWREREAIKQDKPRRRVLGDEVLVDIARMQPKDISALSSHRALHPGVIKNYGDTLVNLVSRTQKIPPSDWPSVTQKRPLTPGQEALADALSAVLKLRAIEENISPGILATRSQLESVVRGEQSSSILKGWRYRLIGESFSRFMSGEQELHEEGGKLVIAARTPEKH